MMRRVRKPEVRRRGEHKNRAAVGEFEFLQLHWKLSFLFRLLAGRDLFAERAGMPAVERALHSLSEGGGAQIIRQHSRPRDGLQHGPMCTGSRQQRDDQQDVAKSGEHGRHSRSLVFKVKGLFLETVFRLRPNQIRVANDRKA